MTIRLILILLEAFQHEKAGCRVSRNVWVDDFGLAPMIEAVLAGLVCKFLPPVYE